MLNHLQLQKTITAILLVFCVLLSSFPIAAASSVDDVQVLSAPLTTRSAASNGMVRVYLSSLGSPSSLDLTVVGNYSVSATGAFLSNGASLNVGFNSSTGALTLTSNGVKTNMGAGFTLRRHSAGGVNGIKIRQARESANPYPGDLQFKAVSNGWGYTLYVIAHIYIENYLYGVLPYEMGNSSHMEALKAQAVAARTYTVRMMQSRSDGLYDVKDTTSDQVYRGTPSGNANCVAAVDATKGIVLMYGGSYITTYYSASNGGQTEAVRTGGSYPYLIVKDDPFDYANASSTVKKKTLYADLTSSLNNAQLMSLLTQKTVSKLQQSGYNATAENTTLQMLRGVTPHTPKYASPSRLYTKMDFTLTAQTVSASGANVSATITVTCDIFSELESMLGMGIQSMQNELWSVSRSGSNFVLEARRYGHGMGMSQRGAMHMAKLGYRYDQILGFYYVDCKRVQHSFTNTIFSADSTEQQITVEQPADMDDSPSDDCTASVKLVSASARLAIRARKDAASAMVGTAGNGALVTVLSNDGSWCCIRFGEICGYVPSNALVISGTPTGEEDDATSVLGFATVTANDFVNLRSRGSMSGAVVGTAPAGSVLTVFSQSGGWARVQYNAIVGYANQNYISAISASYPKQTVSTGSAVATVVTEDGAGLVNLRQTASTSAKLLAQLEPGTKVTVTSDDGSWCAVKWNGLEGYIVTDFLKYTEETPVDPPAKDGQEQQQQQPDSIAPEALASATVTTSNGSLNLRAEARAGSHILTTIPRGATVEVTELGDVWYGVRYGGYLGYAMRTFLTLIGQQEQPNEPTDGESLTAVVTTQSGSLNLREAARAGSEILARIPQYANVTVHQRGAEWCRVTWNGVTGYVMTVFLTFDGQKPPEKPDESESIPAPDDTAPDDAAPDETDPDEPISPVPDVQSGLHAVVTTVSGSLNLRRDAMPGSPVLARIPKGVVIRIEERLSAWSRTTYDGQTGYVMNSYLTFHENEEAPVIRETAVVTTASGSLNLRLEPSGRAAVIARIPQYATVGVRQRGEEWCSVTFDGLLGYVMTKYLTFGGAIEPPATQPPQEQPDTPTMDESQSAEQTAIAYVNTASGSLNLRERANANAKVLTTIPQHAMVTVFQRGGDWCAVAYNGIHGFVMSKYLRFEQNESQENDAASDVEPVEPQAPENAQTTFAWVYTASGTLNLRSNPGGDVLITVPRLAQVELLNYEPTWSRIRYNGVNGYVMSQYLAVEKPAEEGGAAEKQQDQTETSPEQQKPIEASPEQQKPTEISSEQQKQTETNPEQQKQTGASSEQASAAASALDYTLEAPDDALYADALPTGGSDATGMYEGCSELSRRIGEVPRGALVEIILKGETWCRVAYLGIQGFCLTSELSMVTSP